MIIKLKGKEIELSIQEVYEVKRQIQSWIESDYFLGRFMDDNSEVYDKYKDDEWFIKEIGYIGDAIGEEITNTDWIWDDIGEMEDKLYNEYANDLLGEIEEREEQK